MKNSIKKAQSRAGSSFAERENFRPKVKHLKKKLIMTLALLLTVATGAWAESKPIGLNVEYAAGDVITSTTDVYIWWGYYVSGGDPQEFVIKITSSDSPTISTLEKDGSSGLITLDNNYNVYDMIGDYQQEDNVIQCQGEVTGTTLEKVHVASGSGTLADPYVFAPGTAAPSATPVPLNWDATAKTASIAAMPAGNVTVNVKYFAQAEFAMSTDETPVALAPAAIDGVPANTDDPIVTAGTVANIGTSEVKQGTLMYFVSQSTGNTAPEAPDYDAEGWSEDVPTANGLAQGDAYVWYYIKGAEPAQVADRTDANTRSDSDIKSLGTTGFVTLLPEPTYTVSLNKTDLAEGEPALWSAKSTNVTTAVNLGEADLEGVKKSETVTVTYSGSKKIIGVKAEKAKTITIDGDDYTVLDGETWKQFITRNQLSSWSVTQYTTITWIVCKDNQSAKLHVRSDGTNWMLEFSAQDAPIDTDKQYTWAYDY